MPPLLSTAEAHEIPGSDFGKVLIGHAKAAISRRLGIPSAPPPNDSRSLAEPGATFVTLTKRGQLRGCIGSLIPTRPLLDDIRANALAAAFADPRFPSVTRNEWPDIEVEVSLLGAVSDTVCPTRKACLELLSPEFGVILASGARRATFLPQVWEQLPDPDQFLDHLLAKAGISSDRWPADMVVGRYRVQKFSEAPIAAQ